MDPVGARGLFRFRLPLRVRFIETDAQGVVNHGHFFAYAEAARHEYWARLGISRFVMAREGVDDTVVGVEGRYRAPAHFHDLLEVHVRTAALGRTSFVCEFLVTRGGRPSHPHPRILPPRRGGFRGPQRPAPGAALKHAGRVAPPGALW